MRRLNPRTRSFEEVVESKSYDVIQILTLAFVINCWIALLCILATLQ